MAKNAIYELDTTASGNTDIGGVSAQGTAAASNMDDLVRELAEILADTNAGTYPVDDTWGFADPADRTKRGRTDMGNVSAGQTRIVTWPDRNLDLGQVALAMKSHIYGLTLSNNSTDATNDIDIAAGEAASTETDPVLMVLASALTKRLDASWAVGNGNGGLDTGSVTDSQYYIWLIRRSDTGVVDALFSTSNSSPTMPTNYDQKRLIGSFARTSSTNGVPVMYAQPAISVAGVAPSFAARAWVTFNGIGTVAIGASGNVSSVTDNGTGNYTVNFTTAMPHANYAVMLTIDRAGNIAFDAQVTSRTTSGFTIRTYDSSTFADVHNVMAVVFA